MKGMQMVIALALVLSTMVGCARTSKTIEEDSDVMSDYEKLYKEWGFDKMDVYLHIIDYKFDVKVREEHIGKTLSYEDSKSYSEFILVHSEEEARSYPDDVLAAWPSEETMDHLERLNRIIDMIGMDLEPYSLQYPITIENFVDDWEEVWEIDSASRELLKKRVYESEDPSYVGSEEWLREVNELLQILYPGIYEATPIPTE